MIEAAVISFWKGDDKFVRTLIASKNIDSHFLQSSRVHHGDQLIQKSRLLLEKLWCFLHDGFLESFGMSARYAVPRLGRTPVHYDSR